MDNIEKFLSSQAFGVVGTSKDRSKYGNRVLRMYALKNLKVYPVHHTEKNIEGVDCLAQIADLPKEVESLSIITPPPVTEKMVEQAIATGHIKNIWMQPGAESDAAVENCKKHNINVIYGGPCILVTLGQND